MEDEKIYKRVNLLDSEEKNNIKFSVIVPVFNVEVYLKDCLDSILQQDIEQEQFEVLLVNDGSTDKSSAICEEYSKLYGNVTLISQKNRGLSAARNRGLNAAKGKYIIFVDSDDYIERNTFSLIYREIEKNKLDVLAINKVMHTEKNEFLSVQKLKGFEEDKVMDGTNYISKNGFCMFVTAWAYIYSRKFLELNNLRFVEGLLHEDCEWISHWFPCCKKIGYIDVNFYHYVLSNGSITRGKNIKKSFDLVRIAELVNIYAENYNEKGKTEVCHALQMYAESLIWSALHDCVEQGYEIKFFLDKENMRLPVLKYGRKKGKLRILFFLIRVRAYSLAEIMIKLIIKRKSVNC